MEGGNNIPPSVPLNFSFYICRNCRRHLGRLPRGPRGRAGQRVTVLLGQSTARWPPSPPPDSAACHCGGWMGMGRKRGGVGGWLCQPSDGKKRKCHQNGIAALGEGGGGGGSVPWGEPGGAGSFHRLLPAPSQDRSGSVHLSQPPPPPLRAGPVSH